MTGIDDTPPCALRPFEPASDALYPIDAAAKLAQIPRHLILLCCREALISPISDPEYGGYYFTAGEVKRLARIGYLHTVRGVNLPGIKIILELGDELRRIRRLTDFL